MEVWAWTGSIIALFAGLAALALFVWLAVDMRFVQKIGDAARAERMYVIQNLSLTKIAKAFGCAQRTVAMMLDRRGVERREKTVVRLCWCGAESEKRITRMAGRKPAYYGTLCRRHRLELQNHQQRSRRAQQRASRSVA